MSTTATSNPNSAAQGAYNSAQNTLGQDAANLANLIAELTALENALNALKNETPPPKDLAKQLAALLGKIALLNKEIDGLDGKLSQDAAQLKLAQNNLTNSLEEQLANAEMKEENNKEFKATSAKDSKEAETSDELIAQMEAEITDAVNDVKAIQEDIAQEQIYEDRIIEDGIGLGACTLGAIFSFGMSLVGSAILAAKLASDISEKKTLENDQSAKEDDLNNLVNGNKGLTETLSSLTKAQHKELHALIQKLTSSISNAASKLSSNNTSQASSLIAEVLSIVQMITSKVHEINSNNEQFMSLANMATSEIGSNQSVVNAKASADLAAFSSFMSDVMWTVKIVGFLASVALAALTGGGAGAVAVAIAVGLAAIVPINSQGQSIFDLGTDALAKKMSTSDAVWAKVVADVIMTVVIIVLTQGSQAMVGAIKTAVSLGIKGAIQATKAAVQEAIDASITAVKTAIQSIQKVVADIPQALKGVLISMREALLNVANAAKAFYAEKTLANAKSLLSAVGNLLPKFPAFLALPTVYFAANKGISDSIEYFYALNKDLKNASDKDLQKQSDYETMKIASIITEALMTAYASSGIVVSSEPSLISGLKLSPEAESMLMNFTQRTRALSYLGEATGSGGTASISYTKSLFTESSGTTEALLSETKAVTQTAKTFESEEIQLFTSKLEALQKMISMITILSGRPAKEAGRILEQQAV